MRIFNFQLRKTLIASALLGGTIFTLTLFYSPISRVEPDSLQVVTESRKGGHVAEVKRKMERDAYFNKIYQDPATGQIPAGIRSRELAFARTLPKEEDFLGKTDAQSFDWKEAGPTDVGGRTRAIVIDVTSSSTLVAGGASGGIWKSIDSGASWKLVSENHLSITDIAQDTRSGQTDTWYAITGESRNSFNDNGGSQTANLFGTGIYKSTDGAESWTRIQSGGNPTKWDTSFDFMSRIIVSPTTGTVFYVENSDGLFRSTDGGATFSLSQGTAFEHNWGDIASDSNGNLLLVLDGNPANASTVGVFRSTDDGVSWSPIHANGGTTFPSPFDQEISRPLIALAPSNPDVAYILVYMGAKKAVTGGNIDDLRFLKLTISTATYEDRSANIPVFLDGQGVINNGTFDTQQAYNMTMAVHPTDENHVIMGGTTLFRSRDGFATVPSDASDNWIGGYATVDNNSSYANSHPDNHELTFETTAPFRLYNGHDGGISVADDVTPNGPVTWRSLNNGYNVTQFFHVSIARAAGDNRIAGGTQDNGSPFFRWDGTSASASTDVTTGDGGFAYIGSAGLYASSQNGFLMAYSIAPGATPVFGDAPGIAPCSKCGATFVNPAAVNPNNEDIVFYPAGDKLYRSDSDGNWTQLSSLDLPAGYGFSALSMSTSPANVLYYAGYSQAGAPKVFRLDNADTATTGALDRSPSAAAANSYILSIGVNPSDADEIMVVISNFSVVSLFHSTDGGQTYTDVEGNLAGSSDDGPSVRAATILPFGGEKTFLVATSVGVFSSPAMSGSSTVWTQMASSVMGNTATAWIDSRPSDGRVAIATHGRGIFVGTPSAGAVNSAPVASDVTITTNEDTAGSTTLTITDADNDNVTVSIVTNPTYGSVALSGTDVTYTPNANYNGADSFTYKANDGTVDSNTATVTLAVTSVNDAPSFTAGGNQSVGKNAGAQSVSGWATAISAGPANESGQVLTFTLTTAESALFSAGPSVSSDGTLTYTPATDAVGTATVSATLSDDGGTAGGGADASAAASFTIELVETVQTITGAVSFTVDMNRELRLGAITASDLVGVRGDTDPLSWNTSIALSDSDGDGVYTGTVSFTQADQTAIEYKFVSEVGGTTNFEDNVGNGNLGNRTFTFGGDQDLGSAFWNNVSGVAREEEGELPTEFKLHGAYPNPFNPTTTLQFDLPATAAVRVQVSDMLGRSVLSVPVQSLSAGNGRSIRLDASRLTSGTYIYRVIAEMQDRTSVQTGTFVLLK